MSEKPASPISALEQPHPLTGDIDYSNAPALASMLSRVMLEVFDGMPGTNYPGLSDPAVITAIEALGRRMAAIWSAPTPQRILLAGGETTGRLAIYLGTQFNLALKAAGKNPCFIADMAGGPASFFGETQGREYDYEAGADQWYVLTEAGPIALVIGLTADLSTPYVCSMLDSALGEDSTHVLLFGSVHSDEARHGQALPDGRSARDLIRALTRMPQGEVLAVPVGPEPLIGATRSKSASAALAVMISAFFHGFSGLPVAQSLSALREATALTSDSETIGELIDIGNQVLRANGRLYFVGRGSNGLLGIVEASETIQLFCDPSSRVRGFCLGGVGCGLEAFAIHGAAMARRPKLRSHVSEAAYREAIHETGPSMVIALEQPPRRDPLMHDLVQLAVHAGGYARRLVLPRVEAAQPYLAQWAWEFATRLALDFFSTGAHVLAGKTYSNRIIEIQLNTLALFDEAVCVVAELAQVSAEQARKSLVAAIYRGEMAVPPLSDISKHLAAAAGRTGLVARALLLARGVPLQEALTLQSREPIVRKAMDLLNETRGGGRAAAGDSA